MLTEKHFGQGMCCHCRQALTLNQDSNVVIRMKAARGSLQEGDDVLSKQPLAAGPHFFSMKSPDPTEQDIVPVASRMSPAPYPDALMKPRTNVSKAGQRTAACQMLLYNMCICHMCFSVCLGNRLQTGDSYCTLAWLLCDSGAASTKGIAVTAFGPSAGADRLSGNVEPVTYKGCICYTDRTVMLCRCWTAGLRPPALMALTLSMMASAALTAACRSMPCKTSHPSAQASSPLQLEWTRVQAKVVRKLHLVIKNLDDTCTSHFWPGKLMAQCQAHVNSQFRQGST